MARIDEMRPIVLLGGDDASEVRAMQIVPRATVDERRGFLVLSGEHAAAISAAQIGDQANGADIGGIGVEVEIGHLDVLAFDGVVRVALPHRGRTFCTWLVTMTRGDLIEHVGALSPARLAQLGHVIRLAGVE